MVALGACTEKSTAKGRDDGGAQGATAGTHDASPEGECDTHADCVALHEKHWICRESTHQCVSLLSPECKLVRGDDEDDAALFVGVLAVDGAPLFGVSDLARNDFMEAAGGLPSFESGEPRPLVLIGCSFTFGEDPLPAARYLAETIGVPAIIGAQSSQTAINVAQSVTIPAGVLLMTPLAQSDLITDLKDNDLVFRTSPTTKATAPLLAAMLTDVEDAWRVEESKGDLKVAVISARDAYGLALSAAVTPLLRFNDGLTVEANEKNGNFLAVSYDGSEPDFEKDMAARVVDFGASVVIYVTPSEQRGVIAIEGAWPTDNDAPPSYIMGGFSPDMLKFVTSRPDSLRARIRIPNTADPTRALYADYKDRVQSVFGDAPGLLSGASTYDATYAVAFGIIAGDERLPTGRSIARGIRRLAGPGSTISVAPSQISRGIALLRKGKAIDLEGVSGALNFDERGDVITDGSVDCLARDEETGSISLIFSGQSYRAATGKLEGTFSGCN